MEEALIQSRKMDALGQLTGGIAHDFNNLLQAIQGSVELIGRRVAAPEAVLRLVDGLDALDQMQTNRPDLLLLDYAMPAMNGAEVARRAGLRWPGLPIIFITGYAEADALWAVSEPPAVILRKPFRLDELETAVKAAMTPTATKTTAG